jgi:hypothetical protein
MMKAPLSLLVSCVVLFVGGAALAQEASIAASATAGSDYQRPRDAAGDLRPETYVFAEGQFLGGGTVDRGLEQTTFTQITRTLAVNLARQNYLPAPDLNSAQLVIMVHWGMTMVSEDPMKDINLQRAQEALATFSAEQEANGLADPTALNSATGAMGMARQGVQDAVNRNAILLGFARSLERERQQMMTSTAEITMSNELNEERYFVILMAYDNQTRLKERKSRLMWVTRLSVRSPGNNFTEALPALARVGAEVFGRQVDGLVRVKAPLGRGKVTIGELEVLGPAGEKTPPAKSNK